jgi:hypothetical protein
VAEIVRTETGLERAYLPLDEINANVIKIKAADCLLYHCNRALLAIFNYKCSPQVLEVSQQHDIGGTLCVALPSKPSAIQPRFDRNSSL